jgi:hypothetical protein
MPMAPALSEGVGATGDSAQDALGTAVNGTAMRGLSPDPPPSVTLSGTAPSLNSDPLMIPGLYGAEPALQFPDISDVPNPGAPFVVASVASTGKLAVAPAVTLAGHVWITPKALPAIGPPRLSWIVPSVPATAPRGRDELAGAGYVGACVETGGAVTLGNATIWAQLAPQPSEKTTAAVRNKNRIGASCAISD